MAHHCQLGLVNPYYFVFFNLNMRFEFIFIVPRVMNHTPSVRNHVNKK